MLAGWQIAAAQAAEWPSPLQAGEERRSLVGNAAVLVDATGKETIETIRALDPARFRVLTRTFSAGYTRNVHWFRFTLQRQADAPSRWLLEILPPILDDLRLYEPDGSGGFRERRTGDRLAFDTRDEPYRGFVLSLDLPDDEPRTFFLRLQTTSTSAAQMTVWSPAAFSRAAGREYLLLGGSYGGLLVMLANTLMYWRRLRERLYLLFIGQLLATLLVAMASTGFAAQYLFPDTPALTDRLTSVGATLAHLSTVAFFGVFLELRRHSRAVYYLFTASMAVALLTLAAVGFNRYTELAPWMSWATILVIPFSIHSAYRAVKANLPASPAIFLAYVGLCVIALVTLLAVLGVLPGDDLLLYGWQHCALGYTIFIQHGVFARLRHIERQRETALKCAATARRAAEEEVIRRQDQTQFLSILSHEIKTPLAAIDSAIQAVNCNRIEWNARIARRHERIRRAVSQLNHLVEKALSRERYANAPMTPRLASVRVGQLMEDCVSAAADAGHRLVVGYETESVCTCDRTLLRIALENLIDNALKYAFPDTPIHFRAGTVSRQDRRGTLFTVENSCVDLPPDAAEKIFEKYWRGANSRNTEGIGLGLHLVRAIARVHGGEAACRPAPDHIQVSLWIAEPETS